MHRHLIATAVLSLASAVVSTAFAALMRAVLRIDGLGNTAWIDKLDVVVSGTVFLGVGLAWVFYRRLWTRLDGFVASIATVTSLVIGPVLLDAAGVAVQQLEPGLWGPISRNELAIAPAYGIAIFVVAAASREIVLMDAYRTGNLIPSVGLYQAYRRVDRAGRRWAATGSDRDRSMLTQELEGLDRWRDEDTTEFIDALRYGWNSELTGADLPANAEDELRQRLSAAMDRLWGKESQSS